MKKHHSQWAITTCLLLAVTSAQAPTKPGTTTMPRSQYDPLAATTAQQQTQRQSAPVIPRAQYDPLAAEQAQGQGYKPPETWYEFLLKQFNPTDFDYGEWLEQRRRDFLEASVTNPYFWFSFWMMTWAIVASTVCAKLLIDASRKEDLYAGMFADLYNHDQHSRKTTREAIAKYNQHIEQCNRVIEAAESGRPIATSAAGAGDATADSQPLADQLAAMTRERDSLLRQLGEKASVITDLSLRVEAVSRKTSGNGDGVDAPQVPESSNAEQSDSARLMSHINYLQQQLYAERQKNKRLKGA